MPEFSEFHPTVENYWRSIILFGRNVASYKFALGRSLLDLSAEGKSFVTLDELSVPFAKYICQHLQQADKQGTSGRSRFLDSCRRYNSDELPLDQLVDTTAKLGFANVIDAFHVVQGDEVPVRFFKDERRSRRKGIALTDELLALRDTFQFQNLAHETEARWRLVETAWELQLPSHVLAVRYDDSDGELFVVDPGMRRRNVATCRDSLNGYQKGKCFFCFADISVDTASADLADVDHFFPHTMKGDEDSPYVDGVWNLVLACQQCNRGPAGKFARVPELRFLTRLHKRNSFLVDSHHPLRETLMAQTGATDSARRDFLQSVYNYAKSLLIHTWKPKAEHEATF